MSTQQIPTAEQLHTARLTRWHQAAAASETRTETDEGEASPAAPAADRVLTQEALRELIQRAGLVLFTQRAQLTSPAPTVIEATLGRAETTPSLADGAEARTLLARLIGDGSVVALNLLGAPNTTADNPDFVCAAAVFPYVFTLRGDKLWKQPPSNAGAAKVSPLAINTYVLLAEGGPRTASDLVNELGKGLTETAVLRALGELWQHLRVLPVPQADGSSAVWETAAARLTKQIKAGANAGQPTALSALASLYLGQALLATEEEIETFLSPLASRSRVRGVLHDLLAAQQLESVVIDGKQHLYVAGEMPDFGASSAGAVAARAEGDTAAVELAEDGSRIRTFAPRKVGTGYIGRAKPFAAKTGSQERERRPFTGASGRAAAGKGAPRSGYGARGAGRAADKPQRGAGREKPSFQRPWDEERAERSKREHAAAGEAEAAGQDLAAGASAPPRERSEPRERPAPRAARGARPGFADRARGGDRPAYSRRPGMGARPAFGGEGARAGGPARGLGSDRDERGGAGGFSKRRFEGGPADGEGRPRREVGGAARAGGFAARGPREARGFDRAAAGPRAYGTGANGPGSDGPRRERPSAGKGFSPRSREAGGSSSPRADRPWAAGRGAGGARDRGGPSGPSRQSGPAGFAGADRRGSGAGAGRPYVRRPAGGDHGGERPGAEPRAGRPAFRRFDAPRPGAKRPYTPRGDGDGPRTPFGGARRPAAGGAKSFGKPYTGAARPPRAGTFDRPKAGAWRGAAAGGASRSKRAGGPARGPGARGPGAPGTGAGPFEKFKGGSKPWGKRPPARKIKPVEDES